MPIIVLGAAAAFFVVKFVGIVTGPADAVNAYFEDVKQANYEDAYARLCDSDQQRLSLSAFETNMENRQREAGRIEDYYVSGSYVSSTGIGTTGTATFRVERTQTTEGPFTANLVQETDEWKLCGNTYYEDMGGFDASSDTG